MPIGTMVWTVTFRIDSKAPQQELKRYTEESADAFADGILAMGGVAVVTEDYEEVPENEEDDPFIATRSSLSWD